LSYSWVLAVFFSLFLLILCYANCWPTCSCRSCWLWFSLGLLLLIYAGCWQGLLVNSAGVVVLLVCSCLSLALFPVFCFGFVGVCSPNLFCFRKPVPFFHSYLYLNFSLLCWCSSQSLCWCLALCWHFGFSSSI